MSYSTWFHHGYSDVFYLLSRVDSVEDLEAVGQRPLPTRSEHPLLLRCQRDTSGGGKLGNRGWPYAPVKMRMQLLIPVTRTMFGRQLATTTQRHPCCCVYLLLLLAVDVSNMLSNSSLVGWYLIIIYAMLRVHRKRQASGGALQEKTSCSGCECI